MELLFAPTDNSTPVTIVDLPDDVLDGIVSRVAVAMPPLTLYNADVAALRDPHPAHSLFASAMARERIRRVCRRFHATIESPVVELFNPLTAAADDENPHVLPARHTVWIPEEVNLHEFEAVMIAYEVRPDSDSSECIGGFSASLLPWVDGQSGEDALTWYAAPHRHDFTFRQQMYRGIPRERLRRTDRVLPR